jgi:hypothetical protein
MEIPSTESVFSEWLSRGRQQWRPAPWNPSITVPAKIHDGVAISAEKEMFTESGTALLQTKISFASFHHLLTTKFLCPGLKVSIRYGIAICLITRLQIGKGIRAG